jgi:hypothetical protein
MGSSHRGEWFEGRVRTADYNPRAISVVWMKCKTCPGDGRLLRVCFNDGTNGRPRINSPFESEARMKKRPRVQRSLAEW